MVHGMRGLVALGVGSLVALVTPAVAAGQTAQDAQIRIAHLSPDTPGVDVYVDGQRAVDNVGFRTVSDYAQLPSGPHRLELRPSGAAATTQPVLAASQVLEPGRAYTAAGIGDRANLQGVVFLDDLTPPPAGQAKVRFIHAAVGTGNVDVLDAAGTTLFTNAAFGRASAYSTLAPGMYTLVLKDPANGEQVLSSPPIEFGPGIIYSVAAIGGQGAPLRLLPIVDARAAADAPVGAIATGAGGTAADGGSEWWRLPALLGGAALLLVGLAVRWRAGRAFARPSS
jgi:hypothetical protein